MTPTVFSFIVLLTFTTGGPALKATAMDPKTCAQMQAVESSIVGNEIEVIAVDTGLKQKVTILDAKVYCITATKGEHV